MDPYPTLKTTPPDMPLIDPESRLLYPNPVSIDDITKDLSNKAQISPLSPTAEGSETLLVTVPDAVAHLVDRQYSPHLASGPLSLVRLNQGGNGIAVFARVGKELQWPLTKDQAAVKLDPFHYFFSVKVPPEIEEECRATSPEKRSNAEEKAASSSYSDESLLNYGITLSSSSDVACLQQLDEVLTQYCFFKAPQVEEEGGDKVQSAISENVQSTDGAGVGTGAGTLNLKGVPAEEYWTIMAPNVEDYSSSIARAISTGAGHIIRGIFWISGATIAQLQRGNTFMQGRVKTKDSPTKISESTMRRIKRVQRISAMSEEIVTGVLSGVLKAAAFITRPLITSKAGQKLLSLMPGQVALASLDGFGKIFDALEEAGKNVLTTTSTAATGLIEQRYGNEAGQLSEHSFNAVGGFLTTAWTVSKLRKVFYPSSLVKSAAKVAGNERKLVKDESTRDETKLLKDESNRDGSLLGKEGEDLSKSSKSSRMGKSEKDGSKKL